MNKIIGERLRKIRTEHGLTQVALSANINIANSVIADIEAGRRSPSKEMAKRLAIEFKMPIETFLVEDLTNLEQTKKSVNTADILMIADIVKEFFEKNGYEITPEQRAALVDHFYQQNITDAGKIKELLSVMQAFQFGIKGK